jgi:hypothetical protein
MGTADWQTRLKELYLPSSKEFVFVDVPDMQFAMIDGQGDPDGDGFAHAVTWLHAAIHPLRRIARERMGKAFVEPPLEALWSTDEAGDLVAAKRDRLTWQLMIVTADWVDEELFDRAVLTAGERLGEVPDTLRLGRLHEGRCVQIMHVGDYRTEAAALARRLHHEFLPRHDLTPNGRHHEIYLSDPSRVAPEKMRTVVRQPVR